MKMKGKVTLLVMATTLGAARIAAAQGAAPSAPPSSAPAPLYPKAQSSGWTASFGSTPQPTQPDSSSVAKKEEKPEKPNPFLFSWFTWNQSATTTLLGVGHNNQGGDGEVYGWDFKFTPTYYVFQNKKDAISLSSTLGASIEFTNSDETTRKHELLLGDIDVGARWGHTVYETDKGQTKTIPGLSFKMILPTSKASRNEGKYFATSVGASVRQIAKILGKDAKGLNNMIMSGGMSWSHLFARSYNPTNSDLNRPRQSATGATFLSDQLDMKSFNMNKLALSAVYFFPIYGELYFANAWSWTNGFKHDYEGGCDVAVLTNPCVRVQRDPTRTTFNVKAEFDVSLSYTFADSVRVDLGYHNEAAQIGPDGQRRNVFYSPDAQFYTDVIVMFDALYEKFSKNDDHKKMARVPTLLPGMSF